MRPLAIASAVLGVLAVVCGGALLQAGMRGLAMWPPDRGELWVAMWTKRLFPPALILAAAALALGLLARREPSAARIAGAGCVLALVGLLLALRPPVGRPWWRRMAEPRRSACFINVKTIASALQMYLHDYGRFPAQERWCDTFEEYVRNPDVFRCPQAQAKCGYAYNAALHDLSASAIANPERVVAFFDAEGGWNAHGGKELLPDFPRHQGGDNVGFPDGHAQWCARRKPPGPVTWDTKWPREPADAALQWQPALKAPQP